jgi:hypothetical protein
MSVHILKENIMVTECVQVLSVTQNNTELGRKHKIKTTSTQKTTAFQHVFSDGIHWILLLPNTY